MRYEFRIPSALAATPSERPLTTRRTVYDQPGQIVTLAIGGDDGATHVSRAGNLCKGPGDCKEKRLGAPQAVAYPAHLAHVVGISPSVGGQEPRKGRQSGARGEA